MGKFLRESMEYNNFSLDLGKSRQLPSISKLSLSLGIFGAPAGIK